MTDVDEPPQKRYALFQISLCLSYNIRISMVMISVVCLVCKRANKTSKNCKTTVLMIILITFFTGLFLPSTCVDIVTVNYCDKPKWNKDFMLLKTYFRGQNIGCGKFGGKNFKWCVQRNNTMVIWRASCIYDQMLAVAINKDDFSVDFAPVGGSSLNLQQPH